VVHLRICELQLCGKLDFRSWHETDMAGRVGDVRYSGETGSHVSEASGQLLTHLGPELLLLISR
jgi:hypothetical protein